MPPGAGLTVRRQGKGRLGRPHPTEKKYIAARDTLIAKHYAQNKRLRDIARRYGISVATVSLRLAGLKRKHPHIVQQREAAKERERSRRGSLRKQTLEEKMTALPERSFDAKALIKHVSFDEYNSIRIVSPKYGLRELLRNSSPRVRAYVTRIEITELLLGTKKGALSLKDICKNLFSRGLVKSRVDITAALSQLVDMGAVDRLRPGGVVIRGEWVTGSRYLRERELYI